MIDSKKNNIIPNLIAHRGASAEYPENTYLALQQALLAGAAGVEFDVHLSRDHIPVVIHDKDTQRTAGNHRCIFELEASDITQIGVGYPQKFGDAYTNEKIPSLHDIVCMLQDWPQRKAFVELKRSSLHHYGIETVVDKILPVLQPIKRQTVIISYNENALSYARQCGVSHVGWVFDEPNEQSLQVAQELRPEYLVSDAEAVPELLNPLWPGDWQWMLFEVNDPNHALEWAARGAGYIETNSLEPYARHTAFSSGFDEK